MTDATTVFLVRHAAHDRLDRVLTGRMPGVRLGAVGRDQARRVAARLARERIAVIYSSPLERARETAEPIAAALGLSAESSDALHEIDVGDWTGASFDDLRQDERWHGWNRDRAEGQPPGGETMAAVGVRVTGALHAWRSAHPGQGVIAVSHADVIKALVCAVLGLSLDRHGAFEIAPASVTALVAWEGGAKLVTLNEQVAT